ncbi:MAG: hypothetical protein EXS64_01785 [Candidatus Latescibacteria bacterium]|nr:hypothetical protein [Candidatus Latescibacterota bacterium]
MGTVTQGAVHLASHVGAIRLRLSPASAFEVRAVVDQMGKVHADLPLQIVEEGAGFLHGKLNGGGADIRLKTNIGEIHIGPSEGKGHE